MAKSYLDAVREGFPTVMATCNGDPFVYDNLEWTGGDALPSQDDLDVWISGNLTKTLTKYQFRQLFTLNERVICDNFALSPAIPANYKAILVTMFKDLEVSAEVHLDNPQTQQGVHLLEQLTLIGVGRANQILANQPAPTA
jgi:hypothetical protein